MNTFEVSNISELNKIKANINLASSLVETEETGPRELIFESFCLEEEIKIAEQIEPVGYWLLVRIFKKQVEQKTASGIWLPPGKVNKSADDETFRSFVGVVVKKGPGVYKDTERYQYTGEICAPGDWIVFPRASGASVNYGGVDYIAIEEDKPILKVKDPRKVNFLKSVSN